MEAVAGSNWSYGERLVLEAYMRSRARPVDHAHIDKLAKPRSRPQTADVRCRGKTLKVDGE